MIINISVAVSRIIEECNTQTSLDLQAMRARGVETANAVYDDWVLTEDNGVEVYYALQDICADMAFYLRTLLRSYSAGRDVISIDIEDTTSNAYDGDVLEGLLRKFFKYSVLAWWYANRDAALAESNAKESVYSLDAIFAMCIPRTGTIVPRYY